MDDQEREQIFLEIAREAGIKTGLLAAGAQALRRGTPSRMLYALSNAYGANDASEEAVFKAAFPRELIRLRDAADHYQIEYRRCAKANAFLSACVMAAATVESLLLMVVFVNQREILVSPTFKARKIRSGRESILQLQFDELIRIAEEREWLPSTLTNPSWIKLLEREPHLLRKLTHFSGYLGTIKVEQMAYVLARFLQAMRNFVHGGKYAASDVSPSDGKLIEACRVAVITCDELTGSLLARFIQDCKNVQGPAEIS